MFCQKCGEAIPDNSAVCSKCGMNLTAEKSEETIIYASQQKELEINNQLINEKPKGKEFISYIIVAILAILPFIFLSLNYLTIDYNSYYYNGIIGYSGYEFLGFWGGTGRLTAIMVVLLIVASILTIATALIGIISILINKVILKASVIKKIVLAEVILYFVATITSLIHILTLLDGFNTSLSLGRIGIGCYLNLVVAIVIFFVYLMSLIRVKE